MPPVKKKIGVSGSPLPVSFKEFAKNPIVGTLFLAICGISYTYMDLKTTYTEQIERQNIKIDQLSAEVRLCTNALRRSDSLLAGASSKIITLQQLNLIK